MRRIVVGLMIVAGIGLFGWLLLYSRICTHWPGIIELRGVFFDTITPSLGLREGILEYELMPLSEVKENGLTVGYMYSLRGELVDVELDRSLLYLRTKSGQEYAFQYSASVSPAFYYKTKEGEGFVIKDFIEEPIVEGKRVSVQWEDRRKLTQVFEDMGETEEKVVNKPVTGDYLLVIKL